MNANVRNAGRTVQGEMMRVLERAARDSGSRPPWEAELVFEDLQKRVEQGIEIEPGDDPMPKAVIDYLKKQVKEGSRKNPEDI